MLDPEQALCFRHFDEQKMTKRAVLIGLIWGIWQLPLYFYPAQIQYDWIRISPFLGIGFIVNCITNALVYNVIHVISKRKVFPIFFLHMFENIILTGAMIYPFSDIHIVMTRTELYKTSLEKEE